MALCAAHMLEQLQINASVTPHYAAYYCEENTFLALRHLTEHAAADTHRDYYAVFVSNPSKQVTHAVSMPQQVVLWHQKAGPPPHGMVCWDYHCFALERDMRHSSATVRVFDLDSMLPWGVTADAWAAAALPGISQEPLCWGRDRRFRLVRWDQYRRHFASTREHMRDGEGGWYAPPPPWLCFVATDGSRHTLPRYWAMSDPVAGLSWPDAEPFGLVYEEADFLSLLGVRTVSEAAAEHAAQIVVERDAVLALA